jgi:hypothetical protein
LTLKAEVSRLVVGGDSHRHRCSSLGNVVPMVDARRKFRATEVPLLVILFVYRTIRALIRVGGPDKVREMFFASPKNFACHDGGARAATKHRCAFAHTIDLHIAERLASAPCRQAKRATR